MFIAPNFLDTKEIKDSSRLLEAIDILEENGHITSIKKANLYEYSIA